MTSQTSDDGTRTEQVFTPRVNLLRVSRFVTSTSKSQSLHLLLLVTAIVPKRWIYI